MTKSNFEQKLNEVGCRLENGRVQFDVELVLFRRQLSLTLHRDPNYPAKINAFLDDINEYMQDIPAFRQCLLPSTLSVDATTASSQRPTTQESLMKVFLGIDVLQPRLITYILERLPEFYDELENDNSSSCTARLILHQLRWLEYIVEPQELTEKLIEIIQVTPAVIQHEIITFLPDIVNDSEHKPIVIYLKELMQENTELTVPILDALSNLTLSSDSLDDLREVVLERLESAELDHLAIIIKFLLQTASSYSIDMVIYTIREKLDFRALGKILHNGLYNKTKQQNSRDKGKHAPEALILESIKLGLQFHKFVCDSWVKSIAALETQQAHKVIDVLVLIILYSMTSMKKKAEQLFRKKIAAGVITLSLLQETITQHADGLSGYWSSVLSLSENLLRSAQNIGVVASCSSALYITAFKSSDAYYRQEIVGSLITHIGSGSQCEMDVALNALLSLAETDVNSMAVYGVFIKGILDYLDNLQLSQTRVLFNIFSLLALSVENRHDAGSEGLWSEIQIVIRKQLSNPREKYKKIGIIGCLSSVKVLGSKSLCENNDVGGSSTQSHADNVSADQALRHPLLQQAVSLLEMVLRNCGGYPNCLALVYDELAHMITHSEMDIRLQLWIKENMTNNFTEHYVADMEEKESLITSAEQDHEISLKPDLWMHLDGDEGSIVINHYASMIGVDDRKRKALVLPLCSIFNLLQSCEKKLNDGSLEDIDALLGCGLILFKAQNIVDFAEETQVHDIHDACDLVFYAINWFRELLNAFCTTVGEGIQEKLVQRMHNILDLESILEKLLKHAPGYVPLELHSTFVFVEAKETRGIPQLESPSYSRAAPTIEGGPDAEATMKPTPKINQKSNTSPFESVADLRTHMRALNIDTLSLLQIGDGKAQTSPNIEATHYLLRDLDRKLNVKIVPQTTTPFGKKKTLDDKQNTPDIAVLSRISASYLVKEVVKYMPNILGTLESLNEEIQLQDIQMGRIPTGAEIVAESIALVFNILLKILEWPELQNPENHKTLECFLGALADRINVESTQTQAFQVKISDAFQYLSRFGESIPQASTSVTLYKVLQHLMALATDPSLMKKEAYKVIKQIISSDWFDWRDIKKDIPFLVEQTIELSEDPLQMLHHYVNQVLPTYEQEDRLEDHPLLRSDTVLSYYQAMINQAVKAIHLLKETDQDPDIVITQNARVVKIFERITSYIKTKEQRPLFGMLLKTGRAFIEQFTKYSIPYFTGVFKLYKDSIVAIFKDFQTSTRMLQIICSHVKVLKDVLLAGYVPPLKKAMEIVIFQVKMLLTENNAPADAFFLGALKHRDIRGVEVSSQIPREEYSDDSGKEQEEEEERSQTPENTRQKKRKSANGKAKASKPKKSKASEPAAPVYHTTSQVPTSDEEMEEADELAKDSSDDDNEEERADQDEPQPNLEEEDDDESVVIDLNMDDSDQEETPYNRPQPANVIPVRDDVVVVQKRSTLPPKQADPKETTVSAMQALSRPRKPRLGLGRPAIPKGNKVFSLSREGTGDGSDTML